MDRPRLSTAIWLSLTSVVWMLVSVAVYVNFGPEWIFIIALILIEFIWITAAGVSWLYWMWYEYTERDIERRRAQSITPMLEIVNAVQRLTREQLNIVQAQGYHAMIGVLATKNGPVTFLATPLGNIPMTIVEKELRLTGLLRFPPIRDYSDGSPEREWRRIFQSWACSEVGLAMPADGPKPAMWIDKNSRAIAAGMLGLDIYAANGNNGNDEERD